MTTDANPDGTEPEAAIARVMQAEVEAQQDALRCRAEAQTMKSEAEAAVRSIAARTDARLVSLRQRMRARTLREVQELDSASPEAPATRLPERDIIERAVARLANELIDPKLD